MRSSTAVVSLAILAVASGCAKQPSLVAVNSAPSPTGVMAPAPADVAGRRVDSPRGTPAAPIGPPRGTTPPTTAAARAEPRQFVDTPALRDIHFDFDRYEVRPSERPILDGHAAWLRERASMLLLVEGHCDERGTAEYNISLGERRAKATANYLIARGVAADRITIVSYGEERPLCREAVEECWSENRRAHFRVKER